MYEKRPIFIPIDTTENAVKLVAPFFSGISGLGGTYSEALQEWILKLGKIAKDYVLVWKLSTNSYPIRALLGRPIVHLCLAA